MSDARTHIIEEIGRLYEKLADVRKRRKKGSGTRDPTSPRGDGNPRLILACRKLPFELVRAAGETNWTGRTPEDQETDQILSNLQAVFSSGRTTKWIGWPRTYVDATTQQGLDEQLVKRGYHPVWLDEMRQHQFYNGFCKTVLWPLFHSLPPTTEDTISISRSEHIWSKSAREQAQGNIGDESMMWQAYVQVNQHFADTIRDIYEDGDLVWIHDYHLMLVPQMLRALLPHAKIGFFLHVAFPSSELYRILPYREEILRGILASDLIGFQTYQYARYFFQTCESILGLDWSPVAVEDAGHYANVCIIPIGINPPEYTRRCLSRPVESLVTRFRKQFSGKTVILGVDSLDVTKGLVHKFLAIEEFLKSGEKLEDKVVFVQVALASGLTANPEATSSVTLESHISRMAARINSQHCSIGSEGPLHLIAHVSGEELMALYSVADILLITPIRDGMNVIPFQYTVARNARKELAGVILSEFTGCARSLGGAVLVNPWDTLQVVSKLNYMVSEIEPEERRRNHDAMIQYVERFTSDRWSKRFIEQLEEANEDENRSPVRELHKDQIVNAYMASTCGIRLIVLGLEGVIAQAVTLPELLTLQQSEYSALEALCSVPNNVVVLVSPRSPETLEEKVGDLNAILVAESGWFIRWHKQKSWEHQVPYLDTSWHDDVERVLEYYTERTPGSFIELKEHSIAWHFRDCDLGHGAWQAKQLQVSLTNLSRRLPFRVFTGNKMIEIAQQSPAPQPLLDILFERLNHTVNPSASVPFGLKASGGSRSTLEDPKEPLEDPGDDGVGKLGSDSAEGKPAPSAAGHPAAAPPPPPPAVPAGSPLPTVGSSASTASPDIEFVLVVLRGDDPIDEDIFEILAPDPIDLDEFVNQIKALDKDDCVSIRSSGNESTAASLLSALPGLGSPIGDGDDGAPKSPLAERAEGLRLAPSFSDAGRLSPGMEPAITVHTMDDVKGSPDGAAQRRGQLPDRANGLSRQRSGEALPRSFAQEAQNGSDGYRESKSPARHVESGATMSVLHAHMRSLQTSMKGDGAKDFRIRRHSANEPMIRGRGADGAYQQTGGAAGFTEAASLFSINEGGGTSLSTRNPNSALDRRNHIYMNNRFTPRTDFPPTALLFQAMKRKYGANYRMFEVPSSAAACWALVRSMEKGRALPDHAEDDMQASVGAGRNPRHVSTRASSDEMVYETIESRRIDGGIEAAGTSKHFTLRSKMAEDDPLERRLAGPGSRRKMAMLATSLPRSEGMRKEERSAWGWQDMTLRDSDSKDRSPARRIPVNLKDELSRYRMRRVTLSEMEAMHTRYPPANQPEMTEEPAALEAKVNSGSATPAGLSEAALKTFTDAAGAQESPNIGSLNAAAATTAAAAAAAATASEYVFPINTFSVVVGLKITQAHYFLKSKKALGQLLHALVDPAVNKSTLPGVPLPDAASPCAGEAESKE